ncbi:MAG: hypothetical protein EG825_10565 [Rhodocyclaceae bacterium]|nr:hypothetical protein [Rhodocyclaceae bacterium]
MIPHFDRLLEAVQRNCHITDARHARAMTLCTYLLEMREFCRWEHGLPLGQTPPREEIGRWISEREALWETLEQEDFGVVPLQDGECDPFASACVNAALLPHGLVYHAGVGRYGKPHFFLGRLERREVPEGGSEGPEVLVCGCEYARDLLALPAALQGDTIILRREALTQWLWEKAAAWREKSSPGPMQRALEHYEYAAEGGLQRMVDGEIHAVILHERGEWLAGRQLGPAWETMLASFSMRRAEILARAVRDNLADCLSTLPALIGEGRHASLHFWFANFDAMRREIWPKLMPAYEAWVASGDDQVLLAQVEQGRQRWLAFARHVLDLQRAGCAEVELERYSHHPETLPR